MDCDREPPISAEESPQMRGSVTTQGFPAIVPGCDVHAPCRERHDELRQVYSAGDETPLTHGTYAYPDPTRGEAPRPRQ